MKTPLIIATESDREGRGKGVGDFGVDAFTFSFVSACLFGSWATNKNTIQTNKNWVFIS